jgi:hypothetical protein
MDKNKYPHVELEARTLGRYLLGRDINKTAIFLYSSAHSILEFEIDENDMKILDFIIKYPYLTGFVDGGLALHKKDSVIRKKIFYMLAILETVPEYSQYFLSPRFSARSILEFLVFGFRGVCRMILGYFIVKVLWSWR